MTQKDRILFFFSSNPSMEYTPTDISKQFPKFAKSSVRRVLQELLADNKLIRETRGHYNINDEEFLIYRKSLGLTLYCSKQEQNFKAIIFESSKLPNRENKLKSALFDYTIDECGEIEKANLGYEVDEWYDIEELGVITFERD